MRKKYDIIIGIDPDVDKNGICYLDTRTREIRTFKLPFSAFIFNWIKELEQDNRFLESSKCFVIEGGWKITTNWHVTRRQSAHLAARIGEMAGRNHQSGILLEEVIKHMGYDVDVILPLKKCWKGKDGKITREELAFFTGYNERTNQEERDAALLAWVYAGFSVKIKTV